MTEETSASPLVRVAAVGDDLVQGADHLLALQELGSVALRAYRAARERRLKSFLRTLDYEISRHGDKAKERLRDLLESDAGSEILADFAESAVRSSSRVVGAALAVLYTDTEGATYPATFAAFACNALEGLSDTSVNFFLAVTDVQPSDMAVGEQPQFEVYLFDNLLRRNPAIGELAPTMAEQVALINELQDRGLLLREHGSRYGGAGSSGITYGVSQPTKGIRHLLLRAKSILPELKPADR